MRQKNAPFLELKIFFKKRLKVKYRSTISERNLFKNNAWYAPTSESSKRKGSLPYSKARSYSIPNILKKSLDVKTEKALYRRFIPRTLSRDFWSYIEHIEANFAFA